jgi:hypothetical protein
MSLSKEGPGEFRFWRKSDIHPLSCPLNSSQIFLAGGIEVRTKNSMHEPHRLCPRSRAKSAATFQYSKASRSRASSATVLVACPVMVVIDVVHTWYMGGRNSGSNMLRTMMTIAASITGGRRRVLRPTLNSRAAVSSFRTGIS